MFLDRLRCMNDVEPRSAAMNMAVDEALLLGRGETDLPVLRHYRWRARSVSIGYFNHYREVAGDYLGWELVRRWTGGGVVEHDADFTYSLVLPAGTRGVPANERIYQEVHTALGNGLRHCGVFVELVTAPDANASRACFDRAVPADLKSGNRKVAGAAMRRHRRGVLLQGSVQGLPIPSGLLEAFAGRLAREVCWELVTPELLRVGEAVATQKYALRAWTERR